ncbi:hypothetical protein Pmani_028657 [Petrolisthes manimaculis]|uniref:dolichol kinase n=1 Tax=Petrolisthes manimaculis TaxID=1843537 RepID=A0AAE1NZM9_9EUCA|nr:hypothetical protein Pmani_028657 [Petrolisthes manimaculis]
MKKLMNINVLPTVSPLHLENLITRNGASAGVWLVVLIPLACSPGLYDTHTHCHPSPRLLSLLAIQVGVSGIHLYRQICLSRSNHKTPTGKEAGTNGNEQEGSVRRPSILLRLATHPYTPALITAVAISLLTDIHPIVAGTLTTICARVLYQTTHWLFHAFPGSFSLGEGAVAGQTAALTLTCSLYSLGFTLVHPKVLTYSQQTSALIQMGVVVVAALVTGLYRIPRLRSARLFVPYVCLCGAVGAGGASLVMGEWVVGWLVDTITHSHLRMTLLGWWAGLTLLALALTSWARRRSGVAVTVLRKVYHLVIVLVFVPGILLDPVFTHLAAAAATLLCLLLEVVRLESVEPLSTIIGRAFAPFLDEKDGGALILSHIYLLVGVASPLWLTPCPIGETSMGQWPGSPRSVLPLLSGVLAVGVGDTAASIGGTYMGRRRWVGTKKTVEGSLCGLAAQMVAVAGLTGAGVVAMTLPAWGRLVIAVGLVAAIEALTDQVDNIVLPLLLYTPLMDL